MATVSDYLDGFFAKRIGVERQTSEEAKTSNKCFCPDCETPQGAKQRCETNPAVGPRAGTAM